MLSMLVAAALAQSPPVPPPLTLRAAFALADQNHADERLAELDLLQAAQDERLAYQYILPRLDLVGQVTRQYAAPQTAITVFPAPPFPLVTEMIFIGVGRPFRVG